MKSVYYGQKLKAVAETGGYYDYVFIRNKNSKELAELIENANLNKEENTDRYTLKMLYPIDKEVFLEEKDVSYVSKIEDKIEIRGKKGVIIDRRHDVTTDTMYYYTNITVFIDESDYKESKIRALDCIIESAEQRLEYELYLEKERNKNKIKAMFVEKERIKAEEEQNKTFIGRIINWFKG